MDKSLKVLPQKFVGKFRPDKGRFAEALVFEPDDREVLGARGRLYAVLDLRGDPKLELPRLGSQGLAVLKEQYYGSGQASPLAALKEAIRASRENLLKEAFGGQRAGAEDVLKVSLAAAVLWGAVLYVGKKGSAAVYLNRGGRFSELGDSGSENFFSASGMVNEGDRLILSSGGFDRSSAVGDIADDFQIPAGTAALSLDFHFERLPAEEEFLHITPVREKKPFWRTFPALLKRPSESTLPKRRPQQKASQGRFLKLGLTALLLLAFLLASAFTIKKRRENFRAAEVARLTANAEQELAAAKDFVGLNNVKARDLLLLAKESLKEAREIDPQVVEAAPKIDEINALLDEAGNVVRLAKLDLLYDLKISGEGLLPNALTGGSRALYVAAYLGDGGSSAVYRLERSDPPVLKKAFNKALQQVSNLHFDGEKLFLLSLEGAAVFDTLRESFVVEDLGLDFPADQVADLDSYLGNLYLLVPARNQIFKLTSLEDGYSLPQSWAEDGTGLTSAVSMAIDGFIYVLTSDGKVLKFEKGVLKGDFSVKGLDSPFSDPLKIFTTVGSENLYILDAGQRRVVVIKKTGYYERQYVYDGHSAFKEPKDFWVDEEAGLIYLLDGTKIFKISL